MSAIDWTKPLEAVNTEGQVVPVELDAFGKWPDSDNDYGLQNSLDGWYYFLADGSHRDSDCPWTIRNVAQGIPAIDAHYTKYAIQPMEFSLANGLDAAQHTVIKYTVRYRDKGGVRDLRAAIRVLELMIEREEKAND